MIARRSPPTTSSVSTPVNEVVNKDTSTWSSSVLSLSPPPSILFSSLATTRAAAGGFDQQYQLEHNLNIELAQAAKQAGTKTYVLISSAGADSKSFFGYPKMKGEIEEHIKEVGFDHTKNYGPGLIGGVREESRPTEAVLRKIAAGMGAVHNSLKDVWAQDADVIARAAVSAALKAENGEIRDKVWIVDQKDIVRLGRTEWKI